MNRIVAYLCFTFLFFASNVEAQVSDDFIVAKYLSGSCFIGEKISEEDGFIKMVIETGDTIGFYRDAPRDLIDSKNSIVLENGKFFRTKGYLLAVNYQFGFSSSNSDLIASHLEVMFAKRLNRRLNLGGSLGIEANEISLGGVPQLKAFFSVGGYGRYYLMRRKNKRLFTYGRFGYGALEEELNSEVETDDRGGITGSYGLGIDFAGKNDGRLQVSVGQYFQKASGTEFFLDNNNNEVSTKYDVMINRFVVKVGWEWSIW